MLRHLNVINFILFKNQTIEFNKGFSVFTGETGVGKSIFLTALNYLLGARIDKKLITNNKNKCIIEASFDNDPYLVKKLKEHDIDILEEVFISREISLDRTISKINNRIVSLNILNDIFNNYIDFHSQKDNQLLFTKDNYLTLLDTYLNDDDLIKEVENKYNEMISLKNKLNDLEQIEFNLNDLELYKHELKEIEEASFSENEEEELKKEEFNLKYYEETSNKINDILDEFNQIEDRLKQLIDNFDFKLKDDRIISIKENIYNNYYNLTDEINKLTKIRYDFYYDESRMEEIQNRLFLISKLKRKYGNSISKIQDYYKQLKENIESFENRDKLLDTTKKQYDDALMNFNREANKLSLKRKKVAQNLESEIINELKELNIVDADFKIKFDETLSKKGIDAIDFLISFNKGQTLNPLSKTASGGEMSRLLLSLKCIFAKVLNTKIIIFDEIDVGVSGKTSIMIAKKMYKLSKDMQVLCISHSASLASYADHHYKVVKNDVDDNTNASINLLDHEARIDELANILSGNNSSASKNIAMELLKNARI